MYLVFFWGKRPIFRCEPLVSGRLGDEILTSFMGIVLIYTFIRIPMNHPVKKYGSQQRFLNISHEPRKKPWLVWLYRGLYYPIIYGLFHKPLQGYLLTNQDSMESRRVFFVAHTCKGYGIRSFQVWLVARPHTIPSMTKAPCRKVGFIKVFIYKPCPKSSPPPKKRMPFLVANQFFHNKIPTAAWDVEISTACAVNKANTLTTAGLSVLDVAQSFRLETFSDAAFQSLGDWMMGLVLFFLFERIVIWMALKKRVERKNDIAI